MTGGTTLKDYLFVGAQFLLFAAYALRRPALAFSAPDPVRYAGLAATIFAMIAGVLALLQLSKNLSPFPTPVRDGELVTTGMFAYARHPIYAVLLLAAFGFGLYTSSGYRLLIGLVLLVLFYFKSSYEEALLGERYVGYGAYREKVRRFGLF